MCAEEAAGNGSGKYRFPSPRHRMRFNLRNEGSQCVSEVDDVASSICQTYSPPRHEPPTRIQNPGFWCSNGIL